MYEEDSHLVGTVVIGNSDNKLGQQQWAEFVTACDSLLERFGRRLFFGGAASFAPVQNAAWVIGFFGEFDKLELLTTLGALAANYHQDAIAFVLGNTEFIRPCCTLRAEE